MSAKRMRIFAGPNGSGKTTLVNDLKNKIPFGAYINADDIEATLKSQGFIDLSNYQLILSTNQLHYFIINKGFSINKLDDNNLINELIIEENKLIVKNKSIINSYIAADIAEFLRQELLHNSISFSYETVMSHPAKIDFIKFAKQKGYKVYLYFIATESPEINVSRVNVRVSQNLHNVPEKTVIDRYYRSLDNLKAATKATDRTYIFDNSGKGCLLIAEITNGIDVNVIDTDFVPNWAVEYLFNKKS